MDTASWDRLGKLRRLAALRDKLGLAIDAEEDRLYREGISFKTVARIYREPEWWVAQQWRRRHGEPGSPTA